MIAEGPLHCKLLGFWHGHALHVLNVNHFVSEVNNNIMTLPNEGPENEAYYKIDLHNKWGSQRLTAINKMIVCMLSAPYVLQGTNKFLTSQSHYFAIVMRLHTERIVLTALSKVVGKQSS